MTAIESLLERLCVVLGFCVPRQEWDAIVANPPQDGVAGVARRVWEAEGMAGPHPGDPLFQQLCGFIAAFPRLDRLELTSGAGALFGEVTVAPDCRALESGWVLGALTPGPQFTELGVQEMPGAPSRPDPRVQVYATDEIGRCFRTSGLELTGERAMLSIELDY